MARATMLGKHAAARDRRKRRWRQAAYFESTCASVLAPWFDFDHGRRQSRYFPLVEDLYEVAAMRGQLETFERVLTLCEKLCAQRESAVRHFRVEGILEEPD